MEWFINGLGLLGMITKTGDYKEDALNAMAKIPAVIAAVFRLRAGWGDVIPSRPELGLVENFVNMLGVPGGDNQALTSLLRTFYILHMDHGGGNLSTFTGKSVASGLADALLSAAMWSLVLATDEPIKTAWPLRSSTSDKAELKKSSVIALPTSS